MSPDTSSAILLIHCQDRQGLVSTITSWVSSHHGNILEIDQHVDNENGAFFMRVEWDLHGFELREEEIEGSFETEVAIPQNLTWKLHFKNRIPSVAIFVSKYEHCLLDILARVHSGEWQIRIPFIISNHQDLKAIADKFDIPFHHIPVTRETKAEAENRQRKLLESEGVELIILARYMQILSGDFSDLYPGQIINIHHSFLPAFPGAKPYHSAYHRGVKVIGATSHYVTRDLDEGPIIEQDVIHVDHRHSIEDLIRKGRDLEKVVLSRAIWHHLQYKTLIYKNRTLVF
ncbi:MAG: formyltetrahydrofolate deformylase [Balneolaceae bacterium]